jgi:hypothetical protein
MAQASVQFTPVQVLQAARRAEAEGKMDYALQFYRHLVEQHGSTPEAQEARDGLFRIAEWRWGEARVTRGRDAANAGNQAAAPAQTPPSTPPPPGAQRVYNVANNAPPVPHFPEQDQSAAAHPTKMPQIITREHEASANDLPPFQVRFQISKAIAYVLSGLGWITLLAGIGGVGAGAGGFIGELSALVLLGLPLGIVVGVPAAALGLILVVSGQLAAAVFESTNATLELVAIERGRASF